MPRARSRPPMARASSRVPDWLAPTPIHGRAARDGAAMETTPRPTRPPAISRASWRDTVTSMADKLDRVVKAERVHLLAATSRCLTVRSLGISTFRTVARSYRHSP